MTPGAQPCPRCAGPAVQHCLSPDCPWVTCITCRPGAGAITLIAVVRKRDSHVAGNPMKGDA